MPLFNHTRMRLLYVAIVFALALGVRVASWHDTRHEVGKVQTGVTAGYKSVALSLRHEGVRGWFDTAGAPSDPDTLVHPPGYSLLLALVGATENDTAIQFVQIVGDALAAVFVCLIAAALLSDGVAIIAGLLIACAPQFAWNAALLLPDTLAVLPLVAALYCLVRAWRRQAEETGWRRILFVFTAGVGVGLSCWLRANALLLAPFLAVTTLPLLFPHGLRLRHAAALLAGAALVIAPITIRNAVVFRRFIPLSLGAGQTLLEGIGDYDATGKFGIPSTDVGISHQEAEMYRRPDYRDTLFGPDAVERERRRLARGFAFIRQHPLWFASAMTRRGASMLRLERARLLDAYPPVTNPVSSFAKMEPTWTGSPTELLAHGTTPTNAASVSLAADNATLTLTGDDSKYNRQFASAPFAVQSFTDYVLTIPIEIERGRIIMRVTDEDGNDEYTSVVVEPTAITTTDTQTDALRLFFVSRDAERVRIVFDNAASRPVRPVARLGTLKLYRLGPASYLWTHYPRVVVRCLQKLCVTAVMLPLAIAGALLLARARQRGALALLLAVPLYYICVQSALHTEYRYVMALHYSLFVIVAVALHWAGSRLLLLSGQYRRRTLPGHTPDHNG